MVLPQISYREAAEMSYFGAKGDPPEDHDAGNRKQHPDPDQKHV